jgi:hypothetical protein
VDDIIITMLNGLSQGPSDNFADLVKGPAQYNSGLYDAAVALHNTAVKPVSGIVLSIILVLMLNEQASRMHGVSDRELSVKILAATMIKACLVLVVAANAIRILSAIDEIATTIATSAVQTTAATPAGSAAIGDQLADKVKSAGLPEQLGILVIVFIPFLAAKIVSVLATVLIFVRFVQLYLYTSFASLPLTFFAHDETKAMGVTYLRRYAAVALTGVVLVLTVKFYQVIMAGWLAKGYQVGADTSVIQFITQNFGSFFVAPGVLAFLLFGASNIARSIVGD